MCALKSKEKSAIYDTQFILISLDTSHILTE